MNSLYEPVNQLPAAALGAHAARHLARVFHGAVLLNAAIPSVCMNSLYEPVLISSTHWICGTSGGWRCHGAELCVGRLLVVASEKISPAAACGAYLGSGRAALSHR